MAAIWLPSWPCSSVGPDRDRHQGPQLESLQLTPRLRSQLRRAPLTTREHHVVDGAAEDVLDLLEVGQLRPHPGVPPVGADLDVQRQLGGGVGQVPGDLAEGLTRLCDPVRRMPRIAGGAERATRELERGLGRGDRSRGPRAPPTTAWDAESSRGRARSDSGTGLTSKRTVAMSTPETPSTRAWWVFVIRAKRLRSRPSTSHSSQSGFDRSSACEKRRPADVAELLLVAGRRQGRVADVVGEVEVGIVDPEGPPGLDGRKGQLLAEAGDEVQPAVDVREEVLVVRRRPLEDQDGADVHVRARGLVREERGVDRAQPVHVSLCHH